MMTTKNKKYSWNLDEIYTDKEFKDIINNLKMENKIKNKREIIKYYNFCNLKLYLNMNNIKYNEYKNILNNLYSKENRKTNKKEEYLNALNKLSIRTIKYKNKKIVYNDKNYSKYMSIQDRNLKNKIFIDYLRNIEENYIELNKLFLDYKKEKIEQSPMYFDKISMTLNKSISVFNRYFEKKKKVLNIDNIYFYDVFSKPDEKGIDIDEAKVIIEKSLSGLKIKKLLEIVFNDGWIDAYSHKNKVDGYFSIKCYDLKPYILFNYNNTYKDLFLLSHEIGHALTYYIRRKNHSYDEMVYFDDMEIPSLVNELLVAYYLLDKNDINTVINLLDIITNNFYRYGMLSIFENQLNNSLKDNKINNIDKLYFSIKSKFFKNILLNAKEKNEYLKIKHFMNNNYCFKYAKATIIAMLIVNKIKEDNEYIIKYKDFLKNAENYDNKNLKEYLEIDLENDECYTSFINEINNIIGIIK